MARAAGERKRKRGEVSTLPSGALRVRVYAGIDPISGRRVYLTETVPPGPTASTEAEQARTRLLRDVDARRSARTRATVNQLLDRHLEMLNVEPTTLDRYESLVRSHIRPLLGDVRLARIDGETLDSFYRVLRTCRKHCRGTPFVEHHTPDEHECNERCKPHRCQPLEDGTLRKIHSILNNAGKRAVRWGWIGVNPFDQAEPIPAARPDPQPPTPKQAAAIATEAWRDLDWGMLVWLAMTTGARRGELCALRWDRIDFEAEVVTIRSSIAQCGGHTWEKPTKTHQQRRITLDAQTLTLLRGYKQHCAERAELGSEMPGDARVFSLHLDGSTWLKPSSVSQRYARMCARLDWDMNIHQLRHYSATELIASGVDIRTVAGRLGHGGGGTMTLRVYSAWVSEADQRAAGSLAGRMPDLPIKLTEAGTLPVPEPRQADEDGSPYQRIAADLRGAITSGVLAAGDPLPTVEALAARYGVAPSTAHRAVATLTAAGLVAVSRGHRAIVATPAPPDGHEGGQVVSIHRGHSKP